MSFWSSYLGSPVVLSLGFQSIFFHLQLLFSRRELTFKTDEDCGGDRASLEEWEEFLIKVFFLLVFVTSKCQLLFSKYPVKYVLSPLIVTVANWLGAERSLCLLIRWGWSKVGGGLSRRCCRRAPLLPQLPRWGRADDTRRRRAGDHRDCRGSGWGAQAGRRTLRRWIGQLKNRWSTWKSKTY